MSEKVNKKLQVTSLEEVRDKACKVVAIPGWEPGETFNVRIRRASLLSLIQQGAIPNQLLPTIYKLLKEGADRAEDFDPRADLGPDELEQFLEMLTAVCRAVMVEPAYDDVAEYLTDTQRNAIFAYAQHGLRALEPFRRQQELDIALSRDGKGVRTETE